MKLFTALCLLILTSLATNMASALTTVDGAICHNYARNQANDLRYQEGNGISNPSNGVRKIICPLTVDHNGSTIGTVTVSFGNNTTTFPCTLSSYDSGGSFLGSSSITVPIGRGIISFPFVPAILVSTHEVVCNLPPLNAGSIGGFEIFF